MLSRSEVISDAFGFEIRVKARNEDKEKKGGPEKRCKLRTVPCFGGEQTTSWLMASMYILDEGEGSCFSFSDEHGKAERREKNLGKKRKGNETL